MCVCVCECDVRPRAPAAPVALVGRLVGVGEVWGFLRLCRKFFVFFFRALTGRFFCAWPVKNTKKMCFGDKSCKNTFWGRKLRKKIFRAKIGEKIFFSKIFRKKKFFKKFSIKKNSENFSKKMFFSRKNIFLPLNFSVLVVIWAKKDFKY